MLMQFIPNVFNPSYWKKVTRDLRVVWRLGWDPRVPIYLKAIPLLVVAYLLSPLDLIPVIPVIGQLDDLAVLMLGLKAFTRLAPNEVVQEHRKALKFEPGEK